MMQSPWLIQGGSIVNPEGGMAVADLLIEDGRLAAIGSRLPATGARVYDARGKHVFPGFVDGHVHLGNLNPFENDCRTETIAAAAGGVTTLLHFAKILKHRPTETSYHEVLDEVFATINSVSTVDIALHLHLSTYEHVEEIESYARRGLTSFKFYLSYRGDEAALRRGTVGVGDGVVYAALLETARVPGTVVIVHCENDDLVEFFQRSLRDKENASFVEFADSRPGFAEAEHVRRVCYYASLTGGRLFIPHVTSREALEAVRSARLGGSATVYVETCPQYLLLTKYQASEMFGATAKTTPPVRDQESIDALWSGLRDGVIDTVGSDHCVHGLEGKSRVWDGVAGFPGIETMAPLVIDEAIKRGISLERVAEVCCRNPAWIYGLAPRKGTMRIGGDGDIAIVDLNRERVIMASDLHSSTGYTPFERFRVRSYVEATFLRGELIWQEGKLVAGERGRVVLRDHGQCG